MHNYIIRISGRSAGVFSNCKASARIKADLRKVFLDERFRLHDFPWYIFRISFCTYYSHIASGSYTINGSRPVLSLFIQFPSLYQLSLVSKSVSIVK